MCPQLVLARLKRFAARSVNMAVFMVPFRCKPSADGCRFKWSVQALWLAESLSPPAATAAPNTKRWFDTVPRRPPTAVGAMRFLSTKEPLRPPRGWAAPGKGRIESGAAMRPAMAAAAAGGAPPKAKGLVPGALPAPPAEKLFWRTSLDGPLGTGFEIDRCKRGSRWEVGEVRKSEVGESARGGCRAGVELGSAL